MEPHPVASQELIIRQRKTEENGDSTQPSALWSWAPAWMKGKSLAS